MSKPGQPSIARAVVVRVTGVLPYGSQGRQGTSSACSGCTVQSSHTASLCLKQNEVVRFLHDVHDAIEERMEEQDGEERCEPVTRCGRLTRRSSIACCSQSPRY